eukprot:4205949-Pleurochrysis_carterae.AAC.1
MSTLCHTTNRCDRHDDHDDNGDYHDDRRHDDDGGHGADDHDDQFRLHRLPLSGSALEETPASSRLQADADVGGGTKVPASAADIAQVVAAAAQQVVVAKLARAQEEQKKYTQDMQALLMQALKPAPLVLPAIPAPTATAMLPQCMPAPSRAKSARSATSQKSPPASVATATPATTGTAAAVAAVFLLSPRARCRAARGTQRLETARQSRSARRSNFQPRRASRRVAQAAASAHLLQCGTAVQIRLRKKQAVRPCLIVSARSMSASFRSRGTKSRSKSMTKTASTSVAQLLCSYHRRFVLELS